MGHFGPPILKKIWSPVLIWNQIYSLLKSAQLSLFITHLLTTRIWIIAWSCCGSQMFLLQNFFKGIIGKRPSVRLFIRCCGHSNLVIFNWISSKFHVCIASIKLWFKLEYCFFWQMIIKMADKMATPVCIHPLFSDLVIFNRISSNFHIWFASIKSWLKFEYEFCTTNDNQAGWQNGRHLRTLLVIYHLSSSKFHIYYFYHTLAQLRIWGLSYKRELIWSPKWPSMISLHLWRLSLSHLTQISSKFHIWTTFIKL